jgi:hypothetical protein
MRGFIVWIACVSVMGAIASAGPAPDVEAIYKRASQLEREGDYEQALTVIASGLAIAPKHPAMLLLKGLVLEQQRDYLGALAAYEEYLDTGAQGRGRTLAKQGIARLTPARTTRIDIELANGPAAIYLERKSDGVFCTAAPSCDKAIRPGEYPVIAERSGFERFTGKVKIAPGQSARLAITLVEKPSAVAIRATPAGARVTVDDAPYDAARKLAAGRHQVIVELAGRATAHREIEAHEGKPVELEVPLAPLVAVRVTPATAQLTLDGQPVALEDGHLALPPGPHKLVGHASGFVDRPLDIPAELAPDDVLTVTLDRVELAVAAPRDPHGLSTRRKVAIAAGGVGVVALGGGIAFGLHSKSLSSDAYALCSSPSTPCARAADATSLSQRSRSNALTADLAFGAAGGAAIAAAVLWLTGAQESRVAIAPRVGPVVGLDFAVGF